MTETASTVPQLNEPAPAFSAKTMHGDGTLADYKGKSLILL
jgi:peroxiredoxin 2/4